MAQEHGTIVVTGGSRGIGATLCTRLLETGHRVLNLSLEAAEQAHPQLETITVDLGDRRALGTVAAAIAQREDLSGVVHNAGAMRPAPLSEVELADLDYLAQLHLGAAITLVQAGLPAMRRRRFGRIVLLSSRAALGLQTRTSYSATKAGMIGMARTWALELAPEGITVNCVAPGPIAGTEMFHELIPRDEAAMARLAGNIPVGRLGTPTDVTRAVEFFLHPDSGFVTGQTLMVCGGASVGTLSL